MALTHQDDLWGQLATRALRLEAAVVLLAVTVCALAGLLVWPAVRGVPIYYIPPGGPGVAQPGVLPEALVLDFAQRWLVTRYTVLPPTLQATHQEVAKYLHPRLLLAFRQQAAQEQKLVQEYDLSCQLGILEATVVTPDATHPTVAVTALRRIYIGKRAVRDEDVHATLTVHRVAPSTLNPAGLVVTQVEITPRLTPAGSETAGGR